MRLNNNEKKEENLEVENSWYAYQSDETELYFSKTLMDVSRTPKCTQNVLWMLFPVYIEYLLDFSLILSPSANLDKEQRSDR